MRVLFPLTNALLALLWLATPAAAQQTQRQVVVTEDADYPGFDLRVEREVSLEQCEQACIADKECRAFTYNTSATWCFLKSDFAELTPFAGAVAGRVELASTEPDIGAAPTLGFLPPDMRSQATSLSARIEDMAKTPTLRDLEDLLGSAAEDAATGRIANALDSVYLAAAIDPENAGQWLDLANSLNEWTQSSNDTWLRRQASVLALIGYEKSRTASVRARSLSVLAETLESQELYRLAMQAYEESLNVVQDPDVLAALETVRREKAFRVVGHEIESDVLTPRVCLDFSDDLETRSTDYEKFISTGSGGAVTAEKRRLCVEGLRHGSDFRLVARAGLPSAYGSTFYQDVTIEGYIRDRSPAVRFTGDDFVVARAARQGIPIVGVNADAADLELYRIGDRALAGLIGGSDFLDQLDGYSKSVIADETGEKIWTGQVDLAKELNREAVTSIPIDAILPRQEPGIYVLTAQTAGGQQDNWDDVATQWFLVSDIGLASFAGNDGLTVFAAGLNDGEPLAEVELSLFARNNEALGKAVTDKDGRARFEPGTMRGTGGLSPTLLTARRTSGEGLDFVFLDIDRAGFDLSDRGVNGRDATGPVDVFSYLDRGIYRPGETVHAVSLVRDDDARAVDALPVTAIFWRPDGVEAHREVLTDPYLSGHEVNFTLPQASMRGTWRYGIYTDPDTDPVAETLFLVEDFTPDRIEFDLSAEQETISADEPAEVEVEGRFLYGAPAAGLGLEGDVRIKPVTELKGFAGYRFGLTDEEDLGSTREPLDVPATGEDGQSRFQVFLPSLPATTQPLVADIFVRMVESGGRAVERSLTLPIAAEGPRIGIRPEFTGGNVDEGSTAGFGVISIDQNGERIAMSGLNWTLYRIERNYQWYRENNAWSYEPVEIPRLVANGTIDASATDAVRVDHAVEWGRYRFEVESARAGGPATSVEFDAGWFVESASTETPDALEIALDKPAYAPGETARLHVSPRFAGNALVSIGTNKLEETFWAAVPSEGADIEIPVSGDWGGGVYVTATLIRPGMEREDRLPMRAIGTTWLSVDPENRALDVSMDLPEKIRPGGTLSVPVRVDGMAAGEEAFVTVAAVDVGILNLTRYQPPNPVDWYFGQKALGLEMRDIYGRIIDSSPGADGRVRSGGDGPGMTAQGSPPTDDLLSLYSGVVRLDGNGEATIVFDVPQFNGTARVMAVAWTRDGVGHADSDVIIRDPVVLSASMPKAAAPGDVFQAVLELHNTDSPSATYDLAVTHNDVISAGDWPESIELRQGERQRVGIEMTVEKPGRATLTFEARLDGEIVAQVEQTSEVRPATLPVAQRMEFELAANTGSVRIDRELLEGDYLEDSEITVNVARDKAIDVSGLFLRLENYPYGCAEQTTSRAMPLLYLSDLGISPGLIDRADSAQRIDEAVERLLTFQSASGSFGLWGPGGGDLWLDSYVTDFLTRAREKGHAIPEQAMRAAVQNLQNTLAYSNDIENDGSSIAYALYVLARNRMASASDLRYYADVKLNEFRSPLARAQLGAALALYNERQRTQASFSSAVQLASAPGPDPWRSDYGSTLRDRAAMLALAAETDAVEPYVSRMVDLVEEAVSSKRWTSTQEDAWLILAARAVEEANRSIRSEVNGEARSGAVSMRLDGPELVLDPVTVRNLTDENLTAVVTTHASPKQPPRASQRGFEIERRYFNLDGREITPQTVTQNERLVVVLTVTQLNSQRSQVLLTDLLPGGFEIDNPSLIGSADLENFDWLPDTSVAHLEFRDDRFVAAFDGSDGVGSTTTVAYLVRAVTPGVYTHPAATVEDMYRPQFNARTATGFMEVLPGT